MKIFILGDLLKEELRDDYGAIKISIRSLPILSEKNLNRLWNNIDKREVEECWNYTKYKDKFGYGRIFIKKRPIRVARLVYFVYYGIDPLDLFVCHSCDNPTCCNPHHLWLGTAKENFHDCMKKKRIKFLHSIPKETIDYIRFLDTYYSFTQRQLAQITNVSQTYISRIINNVYRKTE